METTLRGRLVRRIDRMWSKFEETGDERYAALALDADRLYRLLGED